MNWLKWLVTIDHPDTNTARRGRLLAIILIAIIVMLLLLVPVGLVSPNPISSLTASLSSLILEIFTLWLVRSGRVTTAGWFFVFTSVVSTISTIAVGQTIAPLIPLFFLILTVVTAGVILPPQHIWAVLAACLATCAIGLAVIPGGARNPEMLMTAICAAIILAATAVISYLGANAIQKALDASEASARDASQARQMAEGQARDLATQTEELRRAEQRLQDLVATLETPTVALAEGILLASLVGALDARRTSKLTQRLLQDVASQHVHLLVLDVAGVALIDTAVAQALSGIVQAVRLLGCEVVITGIAPNVALTLTHLGIDFSGIQTARSPQEVLTTLAGSVQTQTP